VFVNGEHWSGNPDMLRTMPMRDWLKAYTGAELATLKDALFVPLGPKVAAALKHLAAEGFIDTKRILQGLPHPSGANAERIAFFLGTKPVERLSAKTNPEAIEADRMALMRHISSLPDLPSFREQTANRQLNG
jgi:hypothetical protein